MNKIAVTLFVFLILLGCSQYEKENKNLREEIRMVREENNYLKAEIVGLKRETEEITARVKEEREQLKLKAQEEANVIARKCQEENEALKKKMAEMRDAGKRKGEIKNGNKKDAPGSASPKETPKKTSEKTGKTDVRSPKPDQQ